MFRSLLAVWTCALLLTACPGSGNPDPAKPVADQPASPSATAPAAPNAPIKQLILLYTGDTLSAMQPVRNNDENHKELRLGGLSPLAQAILDYKFNITAMARQRVMDSGGDPSTVRADDELGLLGGHPYLLLDYGGWEREGDLPGAPYVGLQLRMYSDLKYHAVGCKLYKRLTPEYWRSYAGLAAPSVLLHSAGADRAGALPTVRVVTREVHGATWAIASVPLPSQDEADPYAAMDALVEEAARVLEDSGAPFRILLCAGGPKRLYEKLRKDTRFNVVIGVGTPALAEPQGFGEVRADGPVMLPELNMGGQELAACHLVYPTEGDRPAEFNFTRTVVQDDLAETTPYRKQIGEAIAARQALLDAARK